MNIRGAVETRTEGRKRAMWNVGSATDKRFRDIKLHIGASGRTCKHRPQQATRLMSGSSTLAMRVFNTTDRARLGTFDLLM
jgi:hypothetical protein